MNQDKRILFIEDNEIEAEFISRVMNKYFSSIEFDTCRDGQEAIGFLSKIIESNGRLPDLIFLDLSLPTLNGFGFLDVKNKNRETRFIPIIVLSSSDNPKDMLGSFERHVMGYIVKPSGMDKFKDMVNQVLNYIDLARPSFKQYLS